MPKDRYDRWIDELLAVSQWTARQLRRIGNDQNIERYLNTDPARWHANILPPDRTILDEICGMEPERFDGLVEAGVIHAEMRRGDVKRHDVQQRHGGTEAKTPTLPDGVWPVIVADPPWRFETWGEGGNSRSAENHYPTMSLEEIGALGLKVRECAAADAVLLMWTTSEHLENAFGVMREWGFRYSTTGVVWIKGGAPSKGYWTRNGVEVCLLGTRGSPKRIDAGVDERVFAPRGKHSEKPLEAYERIESLLAGPYLELFGRSAPRPGWTVWGNDPGLAEAAE